MVADQPPDNQDIGLLRLSAQELLPALGVPVHSNSPIHDGDIPLHDHDFFEVAVVQGGRGLHRTIHGRAPVRVGDAFLIHPGQWHAYERCRGLRLSNCGFHPLMLSRELSWVGNDPHLARLLPAPRRAGAPAKRHPGGQGVIHLRLDRADLAVIAEHCACLRQLRSGRDPLAARADVIGHLLLLLGVLARNLPLRGAADGPPHGDHPIAAAIQAMEADIARTWSLDDLAALIDLNRSYVVRLFKRHTGLTPMAYLARRRAELAAVLLLTTSAPIAEIAGQVGWSDQNYFARRFRAEFGMTATDYRAQLPVPALAARAADWIQW